MADGRYINWVEEAERARAVVEQELAHLHMAPQTRHPNRRRGADLMHYMRPVATESDLPYSGDPWATELQDPDQWRPSDPTDPNSVKVLAPHLRRAGAPYTSDGMIWRAS